MDKGRLVALDEEDVCCMVSPSGELFVRYSQEEEEGVYLHSILVEGETQKAMDAADKQEGGSENDSM